MVSRSRLRSFLTGLALYMVAAALIGYFGVNAYTGKYGLNARQELDLKHPAIRLDSRRHDSPDCVTGRAERQTADQVIGGDGPQAGEQVQNRVPLAPFQPTIADAMYAPVCTRFRTYDVELDDRSAAYCDAIMALPAMREWITAAEREPDELEELDVEF